MVSAGDDSSFYDFPEVFRPQFLESSCGEVQTFCPVRKSCVLVKKKIFFSHLLIFCFISRNTFLMLCFVLLTASLQAMVASIN